MHQQEKLDQGCLRAASVQGAVCAFAAPGQKVPGHESFIIPHEPASNCAADSRADAFLVRAQA
jgi:hypothetical protein